jgi:ADP-ribose pyrophosphatase YjhB (NUDIX family)
MGTRSELDGWRHCPRCAGPLAARPGSVSCPACGLAVYANPHPAVLGLVEDGEGKVLLARRAHEPYAGMWDMPGGFMEEDEQPFETMRRELLEETGLEVEPGEFVGAITDRYGAEGNSTVNVCWTARIVGGEPSPADDVAELRWFAPDELPPPEEIAFRNTAELLDAWLAKRRSNT